MSAVRRSSMSSCGSSGYFSSSPTLSSSPPVLCNPKSGEWPKGSPLSGGDGGGRGRGAGGVPGAAHSRMGRLLCGNLVTACSWGQRTSNGREACRFAQRENQAAPWTPRGALELGWPFRVVPASELSRLGVRPFSPHGDQSLDAGCPWEEVMTLGKAALFRGGSKDS